MLEAERIAKDPAVKGYTDLDELFADLFSLVKSDEILLWINLYNSVTEWVVLDDLDLHNDQIKRH